MNINSSINFANILCYDQVVYGLTTVINTVAVSEKHDSKYWGANESLTRRFVKIAAY